MIDAMPLFIEVANQDLRDPQLDAGALPDERVVLSHQFDQSAANRSATQQSDFQFTNHGIIRAYGDRPSSSGNIVYEAPPAIDGTSKTSSPS